MKKACYLLLSLAFLLVFSSCGAKTKSPEELYSKLENWDSLVLGNSLPSFSDTENCYIERDNDSLLAILAVDASQEQFDSYVSDCKDFGFTYTPNPDDSFYSAYSSDNSELVIRYSTDTQHLEICLYAPKECGTLDVPEKVRDYLPILPSETGYEETNWDNAYEFVLNNVTQTSFESFVDACNSQFNYDMHSNNGTYFYSSNRESVINLTLEFCGVDLMKIHFRPAEGNIADLPSLAPSETLLSDGEGDTMAPADSSVESSSIDESSSIENSISYSTNNFDSAKLGNSGIFSYKTSGGSYSNYYIVDFDDGFVYYFSYGNGNSTCDRLKIESGDLNSGVLYTYHDGSSIWSECIHFKYKNQPDHLIYEDSDGFEYDYYATDLDEALEIRDSMEIIDY